MMTEELGNTLSNVETKILVDALAFKLFDRESETLRNTLADVMSEALSSLIFPKKTALNVQTEKRKANRQRRMVKTPGDVQAEKLYETLSDMKTETLVDALDDRGTY